MNNPDHDKLNELNGLLKRVADDLKVESEDVKHELSELLAGVDRDAARFRELKQDGQSQLEPISDRLQHLVSRIESNRPELARIAREIIDHLTHMGL